MLWLQLDLLPVLSFPPDPFLYQLLFLVNGNKTFSEKQLYSFLKAQFIFLPVGNHFKEIWHRNLSNMSY